MQFRSPYRRTSRDSVPRSIQILDGLPASDSVGLECGPGAAGAVRSQRRSRGTKRADSEAVSLRPLPQVIVISHAGPATRMRASRYGRTRITWRWIWSWRRRSCSALAAASRASALRRESSDRVRVERIAGSPGESHSLDVIFEKNPRTDPFEWLPFVDEGSTGVFRRVTSSFASLHDPMCEFPNRMLHHIEDALAPRESGAEQGDLCAGWDVEWQDGASMVPMGGRPSFRALMRY